MMWRSYIPMNDEKIYYFLINGRAGVGKKKNIWRQVLKPRLIERGVRFRAYETTSTKEFSRTVEQIQDEHSGELRLVVVGGDGTFNEALNHIRDFSRVLLGFIPTGSANDLGYALGIPSDPVHALNMMLHADGTSMDIGQTVFHEDGSMRYFAISSGAGLDAGACSQVSRGRLKAVLNRMHLGLLAYGISALRLVLRGPLADGRVVFTDTDGTEHVRELKNLYFLAGMNQPNEGGHLIMADGASPYDGRLSYAFAYGMKRWQALLALGLLVLRKTDLVKKYEVIDAKDCSLTLTRPQEVHTDGETFGGYRRLTISCLPEKLRMLI